MVDAQLNNAFRHEASGFFCSSALADSNALGNASKFLEHSIADILVFYGWRIPRVVYCILKLSIF